MEPRVHRTQFQPPRGFMEDPHGRKPPQRMFVPLPIFPPNSPQTLGPMAFLIEHKTGTVNRINLEQPDEKTSSPDEQPSVPKYEPKYTWEYSLLLQATPEEVRKEVEVLISDLIVRLKQLLFNSLFCAYYVGFIPMQFANVSAWECGNGIIAFAL